MTTREYNFIVGPETSTLPTVGTPTSPTDLVTLEYADANYVQGKAPVATIVALQGIASADRTDNDLVVVDAENTAYKFDSGSSATADGYLIVQPTVGTGRWYRIIEGGNVQFTRTEINNQGELRLKELASNGSNYVGWKSPAAVTTDKVYEMPSTEVSGGSLQPNGSGVTTWSKVITEYDVDGGTATNSARITLPKAAKATLDALTRKEATIVYASDLNKVYADDGSTLVEVGSGGGSGEINVIDNGSDSTNWVASGAGVTIATTTTAGELPLAGVNDSGLKVDPVSGTDYAYYRWTMPESLKNRKLKIEWWQRPESGYAAGDLKVEVYKNSASNYGGSYTEFNLSTDSSGTSSIPASTGKFTTSFDSDDGDYYELRIVRTAGTNFMVFSSIVCGPGVNPQGAVVGEWASYTPTFSSSTSGGTKATVNTETAYWRRVGSSMEILYSYKHTASAGAGTGSGTHLWTIPTGYTIDTAKLTLDTGDKSSTGVLGSALATNQSDGTSGSVKAWDSTHLFIQAGNAAQSPFSLGSGFLGIGTAATIQYSFSALIPIAEWAGSGTVNLAQNDVEYSSNSGMGDAADTTNFVYGPSGSLLPGVTYASGRKKRVRFQTPVQPTDTIAFQVDVDAVGKWVTLTGGVYVAGDGVQSYDVASDAGMGSYETLTTPATDVEVYFGRYRNGTSNWNAATGTGRWRLVKHKSGQAVGFGLATETSSGLINPYIEGSGVVYAGTYTPTFSGSSNIDSVSSNGVWNYLRIGKVVTVWGHITVDATASTGTLTQATLPIASNFTLLGDVAGTGAVQHSSTNHELIQIYADTSTDRAVLFWRTTLTTSRDGTVHFHYLIK